jgi:hypothetical protein
LGTPSPPGLPPRQPPASQVRDSVDAGREARTPTALRPADFKTSAPCHACPRVPTKGARSRHFVASPVSIRRQKAPPGKGDVRGTPECPSRRPRWPRLPEARPGRGELRIRCGALRVAFRIGGMMPRHDTAQDARRFARWSAAGARGSRRVSRRGLHTRRLSSARRQAAGWFWRSTISTP